MRSTCLVLHYEPKTTNGFLPCDKGVIRNNNYAPNLTPSKGNNNNNNNIKLLFIYLLKNIIPEI